MTTPRRLAMITGTLYLATFATSIPALALKTPLLEGSGDVGAARGAVVLEIVLALCCVGTALAFSPIGRRHAPALALGFVASRLLEASLVLLGVASLLALIALREAGDGAGGGAGASVLVELHDAAFLLGPGMLPAVNAVLLGSLLYRSRLVPRVIPVVGLVGAPLLAASALASVLGLLEQVSPLAGLAAAPIALWEFAIGCWLLVRGVDESRLAPAAAVG